MLVFRCKLCGTWRESIYLMEDHLYASHNLKDHPKVHLELSELYFHTELSIKQWKQEYVTVGKVSG